MDLEAGVERNFFVNLFWSIKYRAPRGQVTLRSASLVIHSREVDLCFLFRYLKPPSPLPSIRDGPASYHTMRVAGLLSRDEGIMRLLVRIRIISVPTSSTPPNRIVSGHVVGEAGCVDGCCG
jgi:hypothetical protein